MASREKLLRLRSIIAASVALVAIVPVRAAFGGHEPLSFVKPDLQGLMPLSDDHKANDAAKAKVPAVANVQDGWTVHHKGPIPKFVPFDNAPDDPELTDFFDYVRNNEIGKVRHMIDDDAWLVKGTDADGKTALHIAVASSRTEIADMLISKGADVNAVTKLQEAPIDMLQWSYDNSANPILKLLVEHGADPNGFAGSPALVKMMDSLRFLEPAAETPMALLFSHGADLEASDSEGNTPFLYALSKLNPLFAQKLLDAGADGSVLNANQDSALHIVARAGIAEGDKSTTLKILLSLMSKGLNVNGENKDGDTALDVAIKMNHPVVVDFLKESGGKA